MTDGLRAALAGLVLAVLLPSVATGQAAPRTLAIATLELADDPRYRRSRTFARFLGQATGRAIAGAQTGLREIRFHGAAAKVGFALREIVAKDASALAEAVRQAREGDDIRFFIADIEGAALAQVTAALAGTDSLVFNVADPDDALRRAECQPHLLHVIPSRAMRADALAQFLSARQWKQVLMLVGPESADQAHAAAFERAARRFGLEIIERRDFVHGRDPRKRDRNNMTLLTGGADPDVVHVSDARGEFARLLPYSTFRARPIVGDEGLAPLAWHWAWERHGAPQLEKRFEKKHERAMRDGDWAAWMAVKAVGEAVQRTQGADFADLRDHLLGADLVLDGFKGNPMNFRPWNNQLRQPLLLATHNWVIARAPIDGFLHRLNNLDTLGLDAPESRCRLR